MTQSGKGIEYHQIMQKFEQISIKLHQKISSILFIGVLLSFSFRLVAAESLQTHRLDESQLETHFSQVVQAIDQDLIARQQALKADSLLLETFVKQQILPQWDSRRTLKQLVGNQVWKNLTDEEIAALELRFEQTINRYVREGMNFYSGQRIKLQRVQFNKKQTRGLLTIRLEPIYLPAFNIQFKIAPKSLSDASMPMTIPDSQKSKPDNQNHGSRWLLYDILVEGISYVKLKKNEYRRIIKDKGIQGLLQMLDEKNNRQPLETTGKLPKHPSALATQD